jgi:hypothetical protein
MNENAIVVFDEGFGKRFEEWMEKVPIYGELRSLLAKRGFAYRGWGMDGSDTNLVFVNKEAAQVIEIRHLTDIDEEEIMSFLGD